VILKAYTDTVPEGAPPEVLKEAARNGWHVNFMVFAAVYVVAMLLWMCFDATKPVVPDEH